MSEAAPWKHWLKENALTLGVFLLVAFVYVINRSPHPGFHDSLSWLYGSVSGWDFNSNATSHLLYRNVLFLVVSGLPFVSPILLLTLFTLFFSLLCLWRIYQIVQIWFPGNLPGLFVVVMVAFSFTWWQQSEIIEVYTFNAFFFLSFVLYAFRDVKEETRKRSIWVGIWLGLGLLTHIQHILSVPFFVAYLFLPYPILKGKKMKGAFYGSKLLSLLIPVLAFGILLVPALVLNLHPVSAIFFDNYFRSNVMDIQLMGVFKNIGAAIVFFVYNFHLWCPLILIGIWQLFKSEKKLFWGWSLLLLPYLAFALKYTVQDSHVFFLSTYLLLGIVSAWGWQAVWISKGRSKGVAFAVACLIPFILYLSASWGANQVPQLQEISTRKAYKGGITYFVWPGKRQAANPLKIAHEIRNSHDIPEHASEWNLPNALKYIKWEESKSEK